MLQKQRTRMTSMTLSVLHYNRVYYIVLEQDNTWEDIFDRINEQIFTEIPKHNHSYYNISYIEQSGYRNIASCQTDSKPFEHIDNKHFITIHTSLRKSYQCKCVLDKGTHKQNVFDMYSFKMIY